MNLFVMPNRDTNISCWGVGFEITAGNYDDFLSSVLRDIRGYWSNDESMTITITIPCKCVVIVTKAFWL